MSSEEKCRKAGLVDQLSGCGCALVQRQFELQNIEKLCKQLFRGAACIVQLFCGQTSSSSCRDQLTGGGGGKWEEGQSQDWWPGLGGLLGVAHKLLLGWPPRIAKQYVQPTFIISLLSQ